jgi:hypothetical protein
VRDASQRDALRAARANLPHGDVDERIGESAVVVAGATHATYLDTVHIRLR